MRNYIFSTFHRIIITFFCFSLLACGYKRPPYYEEKKIDENKTLQENNVTAIQDNDIFFNESSEAEVL